MHSSFKGGGIQFCPALSLLKNLTALESVAGTSPKRAPIWLDTRETRPWSVLP